MKKDRKNFRSRLDSMCASDDLRPALEHIYFEEGFAYATDAHVLIRSALALHDFTEEEVSHMNAKLIHKKAFAEIYKYESVYVGEEGFKCFKEGVECFVYFNKFDGKFPNAKAVIQGVLNRKPEPVSAMGMSLKIVERLKKGFVFEYSQAVAMHFGGENKAIKVLAQGSNGEDQVGIIMPVTLNQIN